MHKRQEYLGNNSSFLRAVLGSAGRYKTPEALISDRSMSRSEKIQLLARWEYDARHMLCSENPDMASGGFSLLMDIQTSRQSLERHPQAEKKRPGRQKVTNPGMKHFAASVIMRKEQYNDRLHQESRHAS